MPTQRMFAAVVTPFIGIVLLSSSLQAQLGDAEKLYEAGVYQLEAVGNFEEAITLFNRVVNEHAKNKMIAAKALLKLGLCYEREGSQKAAEAYQQIIEHYPEQIDLVTQARARLTALRSVATKPGPGPVARRVLSGDNTEENDFAEMWPSFDGHRLAYINYRDGSVCVRDIFSDEVQTVTSGLPVLWHYLPKWSPDGKRIAVTVENQEDPKIRSIKLIDVASRNAVTVPGTATEGWIDPAEWSRDGKYLLCVRNERLTLIDVDNGFVTAIADTVREGHGSLSPDGRFVSYSVGKQDNSHVFVQAIADGARHQITTIKGDNYHPLWSPDGRAIAFSRDNGIWIVPMSDGKASGPPTLVHSAAGFSLRAWTQKGLYFTLWNSDNTICIPYQVTMNPATGEPSASTLQILPATYPKSFWEFTWSPDMKRIAFNDRQANPDSPARVTIYTVDRKTLETFDVEQQGTAVHPRWSDDSRNIMVEYHNPSLRGQGRVLMLDIFTGNVWERFPSRPLLGRFTFSADGRRMAFTQLSGDVGAFIRGLNVMVAEYGQFEGKILASIDQREGEYLVAWPMISPSGKYVLFVTQRGHSDVDSVREAGILWIAASDGSDVRRLATAADIGAAQWDPTGRFIAFITKEASVKNLQILLRVVEVKTGFEHTMRLVNLAGRRVYVADWSSDGKLLGIVASMDPGWEYWVLQGFSDTEE